MLYASPSKYRPLSSVYGKIEQLLFAYPGAMVVEPQQTVSRFGNIFKNFGDRVSFVVLGNYTDGQALGLDAAEAWDQATSANDLDPRHYIVRFNTPMANAESEVCFKHSVFIQDPFVVMRNQKGKSRLLEPYMTSVQENAYLAEQLAAETGLLIRPTKFALEGGNILVGDDYALIGRDLLQRNINLFCKGMDPAKAEKLITAHFREMLNIPYIDWIGFPEPIEFQIDFPQGHEKLQPFFHLDLFLTLAGKASNGNENVMLAKLNTSYIIDWDYLDPKLQGELRRLNEMLDKIEDQIEALTERPGPKFTVFRVDMGGRICDDNGRAKFIPYSYNNAQVESYQGITRAYFPSYKGMAKLEEKLTKDLGAVGFTKTTFIKSAFEDIAEDHGSLHCITKVLRRTQ